MRGLACRSLRGELHASSVPIAAAPPQQEIRTLLSVGCAPLGCSALAQLWMLPQPPTLPAGHAAPADYCTNESNGKPRPGCDVYTELKKDFDAAYSGNRGPMTIAIHTPYLQNR